MREEGSIVRRKGILKKKDKKERRGFAGGRKFGKVERDLKEKRPEGKGRSCGRKEVGIP